MTFPLTITALADLYSKWAAAASSGSDAAAATALGQSITGRTGYLGTELMVTTYFVFTVLVLLSRYMCCEM